jgi:class 3 adenylate cyclase/tetratricopeptide (TPR) repeat protein
LDTTALLRQALGVVVCAACSTENPDGARFCNGCAAPLGDATSGRQLRKTVTLVFCDVAGSTALGESRDPEAVQVMLERYFERMKAIVEAHGGTVQKFIGDAVVAVFGVPVVHEDDAVRALRAAVEMREALPRLEVEARIGVNTGEVVTSGGDTLVTGDAANVAARLQQSAAPGEILVGEPTRKLARDAIALEELEPLVLKGKGEPVAAFRLVSVEPDAPGVARRHDTPLVGRADELALLRIAYNNAVKRQGAVLFTLLGAAGVGKSRLVREFLAGLDARVVMGRCPSYGEGISYRPVVEVVEQLGGADEQLLRGSPGSAETLAALLGESDGTTTPEEIDWAIRKLLDASAAERPLVVMFDDIHWGAAPFLDLVEHIADLSRTAPILLLCMARPELLDTRPQWGGGKLNSTTVLLEPLDPDESERLIGALLGADTLERSLGVRIRETAGGNPFYLEEMVALLHESEQPDVVVPPTIQALLAARLDQLPAAERSVLERGSIEGHLFHVAPLQMLVDAPVDPELAALVRKDLIRPDAAQLPVGEAYRFRHLLIRDSAYDALPKATRAELHERFAAWLDRSAPDLIERDELLGHHLEQALRYRAELGQPGTDGLGARAAGHLVAAGERARARGDVHATANLLDRALGIGIDDPRLRIRVQIDLGSALGHAGRLEESESIIRTAATAAQSLGDRGLAAHVQTELHTTRLHQYDESPGWLEEVIETFSELGDDRGLARALGLHAGRLARRGNPALGIVERERALRHAEACGDRALRRRAIAQLCTALAVGPTPAVDATPRVEELLSSAEDDRVLQAQVKRPLAMLYAMSGRSDDALELLRQSAVVLDELDHLDHWTDRGFGVAQTKELAGDAAGSEADRRAAIGYFRTLRPDVVDGRAWSMSAGLARLCCDQRRWEEADDLLAYGRANEFPLMPLSHASRLAVEARLAAHRGEVDEAVALAGRAVSSQAVRDFPMTHGEEWDALAEVLRAAGRSTEAAAATARAVEIYEQKGNITGAARSQSAGMGRGRRWTP